MAMACQLTISVMLLFFLTRPLFNFIIYFMFLPLQRILYMSPSFVLTMLAFLNFIQIISLLRIHQPGSSSSADQFMIDFISFLPLCFLPPHRLLLVKEQRPMAQTPWSSFSCFSFQKTACQPLAIFPQRLQLQLPIVSPCKGTATTLLFKLHNHSQAFRINMGRCLGPSSCFVYE